jgi:thiopeptide-type bacteriocin biosynthesis protein
MPADRSTPPRTTPPRATALRVDARFVLRTPLLPFDEFLAWGADVRGAAAQDCAAVRDRLRQAIARGDVREALFVASPGLVDDLDTWLATPDSERGQKIERAVVRYFSRMATRPTPFGLFSGVAVGRIAERTELVLASRAACGRSTRLDNDYLFALASALRKVPELRAALRWRPNSSLYPLAGRLRYTEARLIGSLRTYHLVAVDSSPYIEATLERARHGAALDDLARALVADDPEIPLEEAVAFIDELVDSQLLVCDLEPPVTGGEPIAALLALLTEVAPGAAITALLADTAERLAAVDRGGLGHELTVYQEIAARLERLPAPVDRTRLFQVDLVQAAPEATLGRAVIEAIEDGIELLRRLQPAGAEGALARFRRAFRDRYEDREVPLVEALDEESGIGFEASNDPGASGAPLLAELAFPSAPADERAPFTKLQRWLLRRLERLWARGERELVLTDADVDALSADDPEPLPDAFSAVATIAAASPEALARGELEVLLRSVGGPSGARMLGRFCHASRELHELVQEHVRAEEALRPDAIFAEIVHLNEGRLGNILCRPVLRDHEIPFLGISGAPADRQIPVQDLLVSVRGDRIVLRSRRLDREVVPRLSTAHNYNLRTIGIYRFLCSLQGQDGGGWSWSWGPLQHARFLPRVRWKRIVLTQARWLLDSEDLVGVNRAVRAAQAALGKAEGKPQSKIDGKIDGKAAAGISDIVSEHRGHVYEAVQALRDAMRLPRLVAVADADNQLVVDLDNPLSVDSFAWLVHRRTQVNLVELYPGPEALVARSPEGQLAHELVVTFTRAPEAARGRAGSGRQRVPVPASAQRRFLPGDTWLYAKLYTGQSAADEVLRRVITPVREEALATGAAERWFFLRYQDPEPHVRLRFRGDPGRLRGEVLPALHAAARPLLDEGTVWRIQLDTYEREVERYGGPRGIELCEQIFWHDSEAVLDIVGMLQGDAGADARWRLALRGADMLLDDLGLDFATRLRLVRMTRDAFRDEFRAGTALYKQIGERFRRERASLFELLERDPARDRDSDLAPGLEVFAARSERIRAVAAEMRAARLDAPIESFAGSLVHMHINRLLHASQRAQEMVLYDFLHRWYDSRRARQGGDPGRERVE